MAGENFTNGHQWERLILHLIKNVHVLLIFKFHILRKIPHLKKSCITLYKQSKLVNSKSSGLEVLFRIISSSMSKYHIVGNHMHWLKYII